MHAPDKPTNEAQRLQALFAYEILDTPAEPAFDALTRLVAHIANVPIALVSLVDADRQWFKSRYGLDAPETPRDISFCGHVVASDAPLIVPDAFEDERFADNPLVTGEPRVRFYAGSPLRTEDGFVIGTLCTIDHVARELTPIQLEMIGLLARQVVDQLELRRKNLLLRARLQELDTFRRFFTQSLDLLVTVNDKFYFQELNPAWEQLLGWTLSELRAKPLTDFVHPDDRGATLREASKLITDSIPTIGFEHRFRHKDGHWVPLSWAAAVKDGMFFASARDMTTVKAKQAELEATLQEVSEARWRVQGMLASSNYGIIETTPDGTIREFNPAAARMLGYTAEEVVGKVTPAILHEGSEVEARAISLSAELGLQIEPGFEVFVAKARRGIPDEREWTYIRKDGSRFSVDLSVTARSNAAGEIIGFMGIASDISARKRAEALLHQSEVRLHAMFAGMAEGVVIQDQSGAICEANAAAERILGLSRDQLLGRASIDPRWGSTRPDGSPFPGEQHPSMVTLRTGQAQSDVLMLINRPNGERTLVSINTEPLVLSPGSKTVDAVVATFRDITRQAQTESALREQQVAVQEREVRLRSVIDTAVDAIITIDARGTMQSANTAVERLFGYEPSALIGQNVKILMPAPYHEQHDGYLSNYLRTGERKIIGTGREVTAARKDGSTFPAELAVSEFFLEGQRYFTGVVRDISDRKRIERMQSEFVSTVSHELRTPLTSIRGSLGLISGGVLGEIPKEAKEYVDIALSNSDRLVRLINDILDMEKMQSGSMEFRLQATELRAAVESAVAANQGYATAHHTQLMVSTPIPPGEVLVDPDRLAQVLTNLISNAAKFSPAGAAVEVSAELIGERVRVSVRDHGPGIPKEFEGRIFERFSQADASSTRNKGGTGLGLSITKAIVEKMRGRVGFQPADGGGTIFFFDLPYLHPVQDPRAASSSGRILVCEDDPDLARLLEGLLGSAGYAVHVAPTLERARRLLAQHHYDAITLDLVLADGDSGALIPELRAALATRFVPIIVLSGSDRHLGASAVLVNDMISKPFEETRLLASIANAIAGTQNTKPSVLHVEDDPDIRRIVRKTLPATWDVVGADSLSSAKQELASATFDLVLLDLSLPDGGGDELLGLVGRAQVIIFSAQDASADLARRVSAALVKSRSTPLDLRDKIVSLISRRKPASYERRSEKETP